MPRTTSLGLLGVLLCAGLASAQSPMPQPPDYPGSGAPMAGREVGADVPMASSPVYAPLADNGVPQQLPDLRGSAPLPAPASAAQLSPSPGPIWQAAYQAAPGPGGAGLSDVPESFPIRLEPPPMGRVALSGQTDEALQERMRQEYRERRIAITFPDGPVLSTDTYQGRDFEARKMVVAPNYVIYRRLYFQQVNFERYGWDLGPLTPVLSAGGFFLDFAMLPYHFGTDPCRCIDSNAGYCLPGDPVPLLLYPPELSLTGGAAEVGAILTLVAIFP